MDLQHLSNQIKAWANELGFQQVGITDIDLSSYAQDLREFLEKDYHGEMHYMENHEALRTHPEKLLPGALRIISVGINYLPPHTNIVSTLNNPEKAYISRYALGGDYHKLIRKRLSQLAQKINEQVSGYGYRACADSAPLMEKPLGEKAGLGWIGKNTLLLNKNHGSWFFLGELLTNLPLPVNEVKQEDACGKCRACISICPTQAIVAPYKIDARRCISYLTIELKTAIPVEFRRAMGNRIYGCDDCQLVCPWNGYAKPTDEKAFHPRHGLDSTDLLTLFNWTEEDFLKNTEGSPIRRIGHERWLRNIAVALGNAPYHLAIVEALTKKLEHPSELVREHVQWALEEQKAKEFTPDMTTEIKPQLTLLDKINKHYS